MPDQLSLAIEAAAPNPAAGKTEWVGLWDAGRLQLLHSAVGLAWGVAEAGSAAGAACLGYGSQ